MNKFNFIIEPEQLGCCLTYSIYKYIPNLSYKDNTLENIIKKELESEINEMLSILKEKARELFYKLYIEEKKIKDPRKSKF